MTDPTIPLPGFAEFFHGLWGHQPFPWQTRAADLAAAGQPIDHIDVPPALGKTGMIDAWVWALAVNPRHVTRRLVYVINRRIVVDAAHQRATTIAAKLAAADPTGPVGQIAERLRTLTGDAAPLAAARLRGGTVIGDDWVRRPDQPLVITATSYQAGSRLMFRGYGVSTGARPIHAGLLGMDAWWIVDEAHLTTPFVATIRRAARMQAAAPVQPTRLMHVTSMSATLTDTPTPGATTIALDVADRAHPVITQRLAAPRTLRLHETDPKTFAKTMVERVTAALGNGRQLVGVYVNTPTEARHIHTLLTTGKQPAVTADHAVLFTGRQRPADRAALVAEWLPRMAADRASTQPGPWVVVTTQVLEAGPDVSFDHVVTAIGDLPTLKQRGGRLNRFGTDPDAVFDVVYPVKPATATKPAEGTDRVYGAAATATWEWLHQLPAAPDGTVPFNENHLAAHLTNGYPAATVRPSPPPYEYNPAHLWLLTQTRPQPVTDVPVGPLLDGCDTTPNPDVAVCWRPWLHTGSRDDWHTQLDHWHHNPDAFEPTRTWLENSGRPLAHELLDLPLWDAARWLTTPATKTVNLTADCDLPATPEQTVEPTNRYTLIVRDNQTLIVTVDDLHPGDTIIVPATYGGADRHGFDPQTTRPVPTLEDATNPDDTRLLRVHLPHSTHPNVATLDPSNARDYTTNVLDHLTTSGDPDTAAVFDQPHAAAPTAVVADLPEQTVAVITARVTHHHTTTVDTDDDQQSYTGATVTLERHQTAVAGVAQQFAVNLGLDADLAFVVTVAGGTHDNGKKAVIAQEQLDSPNETLRNPDHPLAKSRRNNPRGTPSRVPRFRHEALSAAATPTTNLNIPEHLIPLWRHLIGSHHGWGRPSFPPLDADDTKTLMVDGTYLDNELQTGLNDQWINQYATLNETYGPWGLAWLETLVRTADWDCSRKGT